MNLRGTILTFRKKSNQKKSKDEYNLKHFFVTKRFKREQKKTPHPRVFFSRNFFLFQKKMRFFLLF